MLNDISVWKLPFLLPLRPLRLIFKACSGRFIDVFYIKSACDISCVHLLDPAADIKTKTVHERVSPQVPHPEAVH